MLITEILIVAFILASVKNTQARYLWQEKLEGTERCRKVRAGLREQQGSLDKYLHSQLTFEAKLSCLTSFKRSKALSVREKCIMSKIFDKPGLKKALDSIMMEVFNSTAQPSLLLPAEMQFL